MAWNPKDNMILRLLPHVAGTLLISLLLTMKLGRAIVDVSFLVPMACLAMLFVAPLVVRSRNVVQSVLISMAMMAVSIALSLAWTGAGMPEPTAIAKAFGYSLAATSVTGFLAYLLLTRSKLASTTVIWAMRALMLGLYLAYRTWPEHFVF